MTPFAHFAPRLLDDVDDLLVFVLCRKLRKLVLQEGQAQGVLHGLAVRVRFQSVFEGDRSHLSADLFADTRSFEGCGRRYALGLASRRRGCGGRPDSQLCRPWGRSPLWRSLKARPMAGRLTSRSSASARAKRTSPTSLASRSVSWRDCGYPSSWRRTACLATPMMAIPWLGHWRIPS